MHLWDVRVPVYIEISSSAASTHVQPDHRISPAPTPHFGKSAQEMIQPENLPLNKEDKKRVLGSLLLHARAIDNKLLYALHTIARKQAAPMELRNKWVKPVLDYDATHPFETTKYQANNMRLKIHSDSSYLNEDNAKSNYSGTLFLGCVKNDDETLRLNSCILFPTSYLNWSMRPPQNQNKEDCLTTHRMLYCPLTRPEWNVTPTYTGHANLCQ